MSRPRKQPQRRESNRDAARPGEAELDARSPTAARRRIAWPAQRDGAGRLVRRVARRAVRPNVVYMRRARIARTEPRGASHARTWRARRRNPAAQSDPDRRRYGRRLERCSGHFAGRAARNSGRRLQGADYLALARSLGSDVPFFLVETAALVEGTGERVTALGPVPPWYAVIVKPPVPVSTAWAYERIDASTRQTRARSHSVSLQMGEALQRGDFESVQALLQNDFHDVLASATPEIAATLDALQTAGARRPMLTGSGSCVFALAQTSEEAQTLARAVRLPNDYRVFRSAFWNGAAWRNAA